MITRSIPTWSDVYNKSAAKVELTALEQFIFDQEPNGPDGAILFRKQLLAVVQEVSTMSEHPYAVGTLVRVCKIGGPKMVVATVHKGTARFELTPPASEPKSEYGYDCIWFDKDDHIQSALFNQRMVEKCR